VDVSRLGHPNPRSIRRRARHRQCPRKEISLAFEDLRNARGDEQIRAALRAVNYWDTELTRLYREAAAKWP
jgi:hypothetical protein